MANKNKAKKVHKFDFVLKEDIAIIEPKEKKGRWAFTAGLTSGNITKFVLLNILMFICLFPTIMFILRRNNVIFQMASAYPFTQNIFTGYPAIPLVSGVTAQITFYADRFFYLAVLCYAFLGSLALTGALYLVRNLVWSNGNFAFKDFFRGIKKNYLKILFYSLLYSFILIGCLYSISISNFMNSDSKKWYFVIAKICAFAIIFVTSIIYLYTCTFTVVYKSKLFEAIKVASILTFRFFIPNVFFLLFSLIPFLLMLIFSSGLLATIAMFLVTLLGISFFILCWTSYNMFVYEKVINSIRKKWVNIEKIKTKDETESEEEDENEDLPSFKGVKPITDEEIVIEELPTYFSREDIKRLEESKRKMREDSDEYKKAHSEDSNN